MGAEQNHLGLVLEDAERWTIKAVRFRAKGMKVEPGDEVGLYGAPMINEFRGKKNVEFMIERFEEK